MFKGQCQEIFKCSSGSQMSRKSFRTMWKLPAGIQYSFMRHFLYKFPQSVNCYMEILSKSCSFLPFGEIVKMHFIIGIVLTTPLRSCICRHRSSQIIKEGKCKVNLIKKTYAHSSQSSHQSMLFWIHFFIIN